MFGFINFIMKKNNLSIKAISLIFLFSISLTLDLPSSADDSIQSQEKNETNITTPTDIAQGEKERPRTTYGTSGFWWGFNAMISFIWGIIGITFGVLYVFVYQLFYELFYIQGIKRAFLFLYKLFLEDQS